MGFCGSRFALRPRAAILGMLLAAAVVALFYALPFAPASAGHGKPPGFFETIAIAPLLRDSVTLWATSARAATESLQGHFARPQPQMPLFVAVTSPVGAFDMRARRRGPWLKSLEASGQLQYLFFVGLSDTAAEQAALRHEMLTFGDVVQLHVLDTFENLTLKSVGAAAWADKFVAAASAGRPWHFLKVEDFMENDFTAILEVVHSEARAFLVDGRLVPYYAGDMLFNHNPVGRAGRWGCPPRHCAYDAYPTKYAGGQYLLNSAAVNLLATQGLPGLSLDDPYPIEDHYVASVLAAVGVPVEHERKVWWKADPVPAPGVVTRGGKHFLRYPPSSIVALGASLHT